MRPRSGSAVFRCAVADVLAPTPDAVRLEGVTKIYAAPGRPAAKVIDTLDLHVRPGEFVSLVGPSGCGKSTVLKLISGLLPVSDGRVVVMGKAVAGAAARRRLHVPARHAAAVGRASPEISRSRSN